jgi:hypothetical protein
MRQREDAWVRERERLCAEIENHQQANVEADEWYRELEMKNEALEEQNNRLVLEARAATSAPEWARLVKLLDHPSTVRAGPPPRRMTMSAGHYRSPYQQETNGGIEDEIHRANEQVQHQVQQPQVP